MILVGVIAVSGFLIFQGFRLPHFTDKYDPDQQTTRARQVKSEIDENRTAAVVDGREPTLDVIARTKDLDTPVNPSPYKLSKLLELKRSGSIVRRQDPQIKAPRSIMTTPVVASIAWQNKKSTDPEDYPLHDLDPADALDQKDNPRPRPRPTRRPRLAGSGDDAEEDDSEDFGFGASAERGGGDRPASSMSNSPARRFRDSNNFGVTPRTVNGNPPIPYVASFIAGAAVVPHQELYESYNLALRDTDAYSPNRDIPIYTNMEVQRADVTKKPVDQLTEEDWSLVWTFDHYQKVAAYFWAGYAPEIVPQEFRNDRLSLWIPPVLLDDYRTFVTHPLIPMVSPLELEPEEEAIENINPNSEELFSNTGPVAAPRAAGGAGSLRLGGLRGNELGSGSRSGSLGSLGRQNSDEEDPVEYKLIRFYDFPGIKPNGPKPGSKYVYRVRFSVVDPNFPADREFGPKLTSLAPEVQNRVLPLKDEESKTGIRKYQRWSPWSEPSEPISLPSLSQQFVGPVDPGSTYLWTVADKQVEYAKNAPKGKVVTSQFDQKYGARVPFVMEVGEGSVLSQKGDADVVDPISMTVKKLPDAQVINSTTIIDLNGGNPLSIFENMNAPGSMLLFGDDGILTVANEVDDMESYEIHSYAEDREE